MFYLGEKKCFTAVINIFLKKHCSSSISLSSRWETRLAPGPRAGSWQNCGETPGLQNTIESHMVYRGSNGGGSCRDKVPHGPGLGILTWKTKAHRSFLPIYAYDKDRTWHIRASAALVSLPAGEATELFLLEAMSCLLVFFLLGLF